MSLPVGAALVGAGYISAVHAEALLRTADARVAAVVDPDRVKAETLARQVGCSQVFGSVDELLESGTCRRAHVLVPPDRHRSVAEPLLTAGLDVLIEKPMATSLSDCVALNGAAQAAHSRLGVNQNFLFHPAYLKVKQRVQSGQLGRPRQIVCLFSMPLRQLKAGQFNHWMFQKPINILLEQAVHPLSQILDLIGTPTAVRAQAGPPRRLAPNRDFYPRWQFAIDGESATAQVSFAVGEEHPVWRLMVLCDDGIATADMLRNQATFEETSRFPDFFDQFLSATSTAAGLVGTAASNAAGYLASTASLVRRSDPFFLSVLGAVRAFHADAPMPDGRFGARLVQLCETCAESAGVVAAEVQAAPIARTESWDVAVLGGSGFIGRHLLERLLAQGKRVGVLTRGGEVAPEPLDDPRVALVKGDVARKEDVLRAIGDATLVVNLAQGAGGGTAEEIERAMAQAARNVAEACLEKGVAGLVHVSSIAALWLGDPAATVTGATAPDPERSQRAAYARGKAAGEDEVLALHRARGLAACVLRPGVVVGRGGLPFHSGLGFFNRDRHCMGWDRGDHPLPFVLAEDVADAIVLALQDPVRVAGRCYNLVGDVRLTAREYIAELGRALGRPLAFHGQSTAKLQGVEFAKWLVKRAAGRSDPPPSWRDLRSRGMAAAFDCADAKRDLGWRPVADREEFLRRGVRVFGES